MDPVAKLFKTHDRLCSAGKAIMVSKNNDYRSGTGDPYANFRGSTTLGVSPVRGILLRMQDKMCRIATFDTKGELMVKGEGVEDAIIDIINYAVLIGGLISEQSIEATEVASEERPVSRPGTWALGTEA